jgi:hypothetical protein
MLSSAVRRFALPFSSGKQREPFSSEVEMAAIYALAELERTKSSGLLVKHPEEKLLFIVKIGYPVWLFPKGETAYIIDGLENSSYTVSYLELPTAATFIESFEKKSKTREDYMSFLSDNNGYFQRSKREKICSLRGLIVDLDFKREFSTYIKEAVEATHKMDNLALLSPALEETTISSMLSELDELRLFLREDSEKLQECRNLLSKTTGQYMTELDYAMQAVKDETNAKIMAQEELVNPKIAQLNREYKQRIANLARTFDGEIENLEKLQAKTEKLIETNKKQIKLYEKEAKTQAQKKHSVYEKRWKAKIGLAKKELTGLEKELKQKEKNITNLKKQKAEDTYKLQFELESEIKLARQPILELEIECNAKTQTLKQEIEKLIKNEKRIINEINSTIKLRETINSKFEILGIRDPQLKSPILFYVPFYTVCYRTGVAKRYIFLSPSKISAISLAIRLKCALGMSKVKQLFTPRLPEITALIDKIQVSVKQNPMLDDRIKDLGEKNNLLSSDLTRGNIVRGLVYLRDESWLSEREYQVLSSNMISA